MATFCYFQQVFTVSEENPAGMNMIARKEQKSVELMCRLIGTFTDPGEPIFDPFMGTGTTGVAALLMGRVFFGMDKDPEMVSVAHKRLKDAKTKIKNGESAQLFNE
jgi:DNA modification methylase